MSGLLIYAKAEGELKQGDIILRTDRVDSLLDEVHPHFLNRKYTAFMVLTQTCDLVRRSRKRCKSPYINVAVVRPLEDVVCPFLDRVCDTVRVCGKTVEGVYVEETRHKAKQFLGRVINQNEQGLGLFYLHEDHDLAKIAVPSVALLQVTIALRSREHYQTLREARSASLNPLFQSKLGWLTGNLFSRVATPDWKAAEREELVASFLGEDGGSDTNPRWVSQESVNAANKAQLDIETMSPEQVTAELARHQPPPRAEQAIDRVLATVGDLLGIADEAVLQRIAGRLRNDLEFLSVLRGGS